MADTRRRLVRDGYDAVGEQYLEARPVDGEDVALLPDLVARVHTDDLVLDAGCGAGIPVTGRLVQHGLDVVGLDFSTRQLARAGSLMPGVAFTQADLAALPFRDETFRAVVSYYAIIHVPRSEHEAVFAELHRVLQRGGFALLCLGANDLVDDHDPDSWLGAPMYWSHFDASTNVAMLERVGFHLLWRRVVSDPMDHGEHLFVLGARA